MSLDASIIESDYFVCHCPCGVYLLWPVLEPCLQTSDCEHNDSKSSLHIQCKQDAKKRTLAYAVPLRFKGFKSIYFFSCDLNDKF